MYDVRYNALLLDSDTFGSSCRSRCVNDVRKSKPIHFGTEIGRGKFISQVDINGEY